MPVIQHSPSNEETQNHNGGNNINNVNNERPFVTRDTSGRRVTINVPQDHTNVSNNNHDSSSDFSFDEEEGDENVMMRALNMRSDEESIIRAINNSEFNNNNNNNNNDNNNINDNDNDNNVNNISNFATQSRNINRPYMNPNNNFINSNSTRSNDRFAQAIITPLPPPPRLYDPSRHSRPPVRPIRRGTFNQEIPNSSSSTLSVNRDTGNVSLDTYSNDSINLDNSILRRVMQNPSSSSISTNQTSSSPGGNHNFNHHQQISFMENQNHHDNSESHIRQELPPGDNRSTFMFLNDINRLSTQSLYNEMNQNEQMMSSYPVSTNYLFNHSEHSFQTHHDNNTNNNINSDINRRDVLKPTSSHQLNKELDLVLTKRREMGKNYNRHLKFKQQYPKKRNASQLNDDNVSNNYNNYHFDIIRVQPCSFLKPGFIYAIKTPRPFDLPFTISFMSVDYKNKFVSGTFNFEHLYLLKHWLTENTPNHSIINLTGNNTISFTGELVDFEHSDLRYNSRSLENFNSAIAYDYNHNKNLHQIYNNLMTRQQLSRWNKLKPFKQLSSNDEILSVLTCNECLSKLQESFILIKISIKEIEEYENSPGMLCCIDRKTGELEILSSETRSKTGSEQYSINHGNPRKLNNHHDIPTVMSMKCKKYVSPSLKFS